MQFSLILELGNRPFGGMISIFPAPPLRNAAGEARTLTGWAGNRRDGSGFNTTDQRFLEEAR